MHDTVWFEIQGLPALIVMPADTPMIKQDNTRSYGAEVVTYDRATESREAIAERTPKRRAVSCAASSATSMPLRLDSATEAPAPAASKGVRTQPITMVLSPVSQ